MLIKPRDFLIILPALAAVIASFFTAYNSNSAQTAIIIKADNNEWVYPIDAHETITVTGPLGNTIIETKNHAAKVVSSPCRNQTCVAGGSINSGGQWTACLPNRVIIYISSAKDDFNNAKQEHEIDAFTW